jgi:hypothetical protein
MFLINKDYSIHGGLVYVVSTEKGTDGTEICFCPQRSISILVYTWLTIRNFIMVSLISSKYATFFGGGGCAFTVRFIARYNTPC